MQGKTYTYTWTFTLKNINTYKKHKQKRTRHPALSLSHTSYFAILDRTWEVAPPQLIWSLIEIQLCNKAKRKDCDVLNLTIPDFTTLGHILTFPGQVEQKMLLFWEDHVFGEYLLN